MAIGFCCSWVCGEVTMKAERKQSRGQDTPSQGMLPMIYFIQVGPNFQFFHNLPVTIKLGTHQWISPFLEG